MNLTDFLNGASPSQQAAPTSRSWFDTLASIAAPVAGVFTSQNQADAAKAAAKAQAAQAQASSAWTKYIPSALGVTAVLGLGWLLYSMVSNRRAAARA